MNRGILCTLLVCALAVAAAAQAALDGTWTGETRGGRTVTLTLAVEGTKLTGTLTRDQETTSIAEGKVSGSSFSFKATLGDQQEALSGVLERDDLKVWLDRQGSETAIVLRRSSSK